MIDITAHSNYGRIVSEAQTYVRYILSVITNNNFKKIILKEFDIFKKSVYNINRRQGTTEMWHVAKIYLKIKIHL